jgi:D-3-phosphoglycerate dehydrogenase
MVLLAYDIVRNEQAAADLGVTFCSLEDLAKNADFISCHLPLLPETKNLINRDLLRLMKPTTILINTSRGPIVNLDALAESLKRGDIQAAALDVFPEEPPNHSHPILSMKNAVLTPHMAGLGEDACEDVLRHCVRAIGDLLSGRQPADVANLDVLEKLDFLEERK